MSGPAPAPGLSNRGRASRQLGADAWAAKAFWPWLQRNFHPGARFDAVFLIWRRLDQPSLCVASSSVEATGHWPSASPPDQVNTQSKRLLLVKSDNPVLAMRTDLGRSF